MSKFDIKIVFNLYLEKPSRLPHDPDYVPSIFVYSTTSPSISHDNVARSERLMNRRECQYHLTSSKRSATVQQQIIEQADATNDGHGNMDQFSSEESQSWDFNDNTESLDLSEATSVKQKQDVSINTEIDSDLWHNMQSTLAQQQELIALLSAEKKKLQLSPADKLNGDDEQTHFYTGLASYALFNCLCSLLSSVFKNPNVNHGVLNPKNQLLLVLMKLRLGVPNKDLAYRFGITPGRVSQLFHEWIDIMSRELRSLIVWPDRETIRKHLPQCFKPTYAKATCIIDCSEVFIERATSLSARCETYSNYKNHNTAKFLVAVSPTGAIIFISKCWGGRASDKYITSKCGFLEHLIYGDMVLADRGFDISEDLALRGVTLAIPAFTKGKPQLSKREVEISRVLSNVRIHVERAIGRIKCYKILHNTFPISLIKTTFEEDFTTIDKILVVCAALCNLQPSLA